MIKPDSYSIAIVTYHARLDSFFIPLINKLSEVFPDKEIICVLNGSPDTTKQMIYLDRGTSFLKKFPRVRYLSYDVHQSLAKCWNQCAILSNTDKVAIINDDTQVTELFRKEFEEKALPQDFTLINSSWSHFLISKNTLRKVGWFDERYLGIGYEDVDYAFRVAMKGDVVPNTVCLGIENYVAPQEDVSWKAISGKVEGLNRYSAINQEFFKTKWWHPDIDTDFKDWKYILHMKGMETPFTPKPGCDTPIFYDFSILDKKETSHESREEKRNTSTLFFQKIWYGGKNKLKKIYRKFI